MLSLAGDIFILNIPSFHIYAAPSAPLPSEMKLGLQPPGHCLFSLRRGPTAPHSVNTLAAQNKAGKDTFHSKSLWRRAAAFHYDRN